MVEILSHTHSGLRYLILAFLLFVLLKGVYALVFKVVYSKIDRLSALITLIFVHTQLLLGFALYILSPKVVFSELTMKIATIRFLTIEHPLMMLIAIVLITIGFSRAKRQPDEQKHKTIVLFYGVALAIIIAAIPWNLLV